MTIALPASPARRGLGVDLSKPVLIAFAVILFFLIAIAIVVARSLRLQHKKRRVHAR